jgi:DNA-binding transcriptional MerR regulator
MIGEVARRSGLSTSALRYYERAGLLPPPMRVSKRRVYEQKVLGRIRIILLARHAGFTVKRAGRQKAPRAGCADDAAERDEVHSQ